MADRLPDPLGFEASLPHQETMHPLGFPVEVRATDARVLDLARERYGMYRARRGGAALRIDVRVAPGEPCGTAPSFHGGGGLLVIAGDANNAAACDLRGGFGFARVTEATLRTVPWFAHSFLDTMVYSLLVQDRLMPVHASVVSLAGQGLLLCAASGTGKSSLAYACAQSGWTFVSDDVAYLSNERGRGYEPDARRALGKPYGLRLKASAAGLFPELERMPRLPDLHGEPHFELGRAELAAFESAEECRIAGVVFLERSGAGPGGDRDRAELEPVGREDALRRLTADLPSYGEQVRRRHWSAIERMLRVTTAFELRYAEGAAAIAALRGLVQPEAEPSAADVERSRA